MHKFQVQYHFLIMLYYMYAICYTLFFNTFSCVFCHGDDNVYNISTYDCSGAQFSPQKSRHVRDACMGKSSISPLVN